MAHMEGKEICSNCHEQVDSKKLIRAASFLGERRHSKLKVNMTERYN